tara:strand:+ start:4252 stop:4398 length:147 start_codon:yes stop_codon:yes gene_type:complete
MKLPANKKLITGPDGRQRIVETINPRLDTSAKIRIKTSKKQRVVKRLV